MLLNISIAHELNIQLLMFGFSQSIGLFGSSRSTETHLGVSVLHLLTLLGRFRVRFGVGHISNTRAFIFSNGSQMFKF